MKKTYIIDGSDFATLEEFFDVIGTTLIPHADWGKNLDAFNDILRGGFGTPQDGFILEWRNSSRSKERLGYAETIRQLRKVAEHCHPANRADVLQHLAKAKQGIGATVFDWLVEIIKTHGAGRDDADDRVELRLV